jgi:hypothetical protein
VIVRALILCVLAGCSNLLGIQELRPVGDAGEANDAGDAGLPGQTITVSGHVLEFIMAQMGPCGDCTVELRQRTTGAIVVRQTIVTGSFTLGTQSSGMPLDVVLQASDNNATRGIPPSEYYFAEPLRADRAVQLSLFDNYSRSGLATLAGESAQSVDALIEVFVIDAEGKPVTGAVVGVEQLGAPAGRVHYADGNQNPTRDTLSTASDGVAWVFGLNPMYTTTIRAGTINRNFPDRQVSALSGWTTFVEIGPGPNTP